MDKDGVDLRGKRRRQELLMEAACAVGLFAFLFIFFNSVHPLAMHDGDDWGYASFTRGALPIWKYWNPTRVLPEILSPLCVTLAGYVVMPFTGSFFTSITACAAFLVSLLITAYVFLMLRVMKRACGMSPGRAVLIGAIFLVFHFVIFRSKRSDNVHLFYSWNFNTYFYYTIPNLLNAALVLLWEASEERFGDSDHIVRQGFVVLAGYLAIFSNLFSSYILTIYAGVRLLCALPDLRKKRFGAWLSGCAWSLLVLAAWLTSAIYELNGQRAEYLDGKTSALSGFVRAASRMVSTIRMLNPVFFVVCAVTIALALVLLAHSRLRDEADGRFAGQLLRFLICGILSCAYLLMLCAVSAPDYMDRPDVLFGGIFFMLVLVILSMSYVLRRTPRAVLLLPLLLVVLVFESDTRVKTFREPNIDGYSAQKCNAINQAIMDQILTAAEAGLSEAEIEVPEGPYWFVSDAMARAMLNCGLLDHEIVGYNVEIQDFFERYGI